MWDKENGKAEEATSDSLEMGTHFGEPCLFPED